MVSLKNLPPEVIVEILSNLPLRTVEIVAWILSHPVTEICISLLQPVFKSRRDTKRLIERFGVSRQSMVVFNNKMPPKFRKLLDLSPQDEIKVLASDRIPDMDYLDLCGDFKWLEPPPESIQNAMNILERWPAVTESGYHDLILDAERAGVTLPPAFLKFIQDETLQERVPCPGASCCSVGRLQKVPKLRDGGVGGYIIPFFCGDHGDDKYYLYLEPGKDGASCILIQASVFCVHGEMDCSNVTQEDRQDAERLGLEIIYAPCTGFRLVGIDFEAWLVNMYYDAVLLFALFDDLDDNVPGLREYMKRIFLSVEK